MPSGSRLIACSLQAKFFNQNNPIYSRLIRVVVFLVTLVILLSVNSTSPQRSSINITHTGLGRISLPRGPPTSLGLQQPGQDSLQICCEARSLQPPRKPTRWLYIHNLVSRLPSNHPFQYSHTLPMSPFHQATHLLTSIQRHHNNNRPRSYRQTRLLGLRWRLSNSKRDVPAAHS